MRAAAGFAWALIRTAAGFVAENALDILILILFIAMGACFIAAPLLRVGIL